MSFFAKGLIKTSTTPQLAHRFKHFFTAAADPAFPIVRQIQKRTAFGNFASAIASVGVIYISTVNRLTLIHLMGLSHLSSRIRRYDKIQT